MNGWESADVIETSSEATGTFGLPDEPTGGLFDSDRVEGIDLRANPAAPLLAGLAPRLRQ